MIARKTPRVHAALLDPRSVDSNLPGPKGINPMRSRSLARLTNDPICPPAALFPLDEPYQASPADRGLTITYVNPTTAKVDDQTNYVEE
jgi:hypothetical protein